MSLIINPYVFGGFSPFVQDVTPAWQSSAWNQSVSVPSGATTVGVMVIGQGGKGGNWISGSTRPGSGGGAGASSIITSYSLSGVSTLYLYIDTAFGGLAGVRLTNSGGTIICAAQNGGNGGNSSGNSTILGGSGGQATSGTGTTKYNGGNGASNTNGASGGGAGGATGAGEAPVVFGTVGIGNSPGGDGGVGAVSGGSPTPSAPGDPYGGGGGGGNNGNATGSNGAGALFRIEWS